MNVDLIQQQLIIARKNQILDAAAVVFAEKGFHATTTKAIAKRAGIAEGTIYNYFDGKSSLIIGLFERMRDRIIQEHVPSLPEAYDLRAVIEAALYHPLMALKGDNFALFRIVLSEMMVNEELRSRYYREILEPTLALSEIVLGGALIERGYSMDSARLILRGVAGLVLGFILENILGDRLVAERWDDLPAILADLLVNGMESK